MAWTDSIPVVGNTISADISAIEANFAFVKTERIKTIWVPATIMLATTTDSAASGSYEYPTNDIMMDYFAFDGGATEERAEFNIVMPEAWNLGTIKAKFYWSNASGATAGDTVEFGLQGLARGDSDALDTALGTAQVITDTLITTEDLHITSATPAITIGGTPVKGDINHFRVYRNTLGTDDMVEDAWLFGVVIQYTNSVAATAW